MGPPALPIWKKIKFMQNKLKLILKLDMRTSTNYLHSALKMLKAEDIYLCNVVVFVNKCPSGDCPNIFKEYFKNKTSYANIREGSLEVPTYRIDYGMRSVKVKGAIPWHRLHKSLHQYRFKNAYQFLYRDIWKIPLVNWLIVSGNLKFILWSYRNLLKKGFTGANIHVLTSLWYLKEAVAFKLTCWVDVL